MLLGLIQVSHLRNHAVKFTLHNLKSEPGLSCIKSLKSLSSLQPYASPRFAKWMFLHSRGRLLVSLSRAAVPCPDKTLCKAWKMLKCIPKNWRIIKGSLYCKGWNISLKLYRNFSSGFKNHNDINWDCVTITYNVWLDIVSDRTNIKWLGHLAQILPWYGRRKVE